MPFSSGTEPSSPGPSDPAAELVTYAARLVRFVARRTLAESAAGVRLLSQLDELGPVGVTELARADNTSQPTTSAALRALEERGLVSRTPHPHDSRSTLVTLTDAGRDELGTARRANGRLVTELARRHQVDTTAIAAAVDVLRTLTAPLVDES